MSDAEDAAQLTLRFEHRPALGREDFIVTPSNDAAVAWIDLWPEWPGPVSALYGPPGSGKSHLAQVWRESSAAREVAAAEMADREAPDLIGDETALLIDDLETVLSGSHEAQRTFFHVLNLAKEGACSLLLAGKNPPARWTVALDDLRSRLRAVPAVALAAPDDDLMAALLFKLFADRQLAIAPAVVSYITLRMERSFGAARALVARLDNLSLAERRDITVPLVKRVLESDGATAGT